MKVFNEDGKFSKLETPTQVSNFSVFPTTLSNYTYMGDRLGIPCVLSIFSNPYTHIGPIDSIFGTFRPLGGLQVAEKSLKGGGSEGERAN